MCIRDRFEGAQLRKLTAHNDAFLSELILGAVEDIQFKSKDGADIHGLIVKPPAFVAGQKYPTILWIHGGPNGQDEHSPVSYTHLDVYKRQDDESMDIGAVFALELNVLDSAKYELREKYVIVSSELAQLSAFERVHLGKRVVVRLQQRRMTSRRGQRRDDKFSRAECFTADRAARQVLSLIHIFLSSGISPHCSLCCTCSQ